MKYNGKRKLDFTQLADCLAGKKLMPTKEKHDSNHGIFNIKQKCDQKK